MIEKTRSAGRFSRDFVLGFMRATTRAWNGFFERRVPMMAAGLAFYFLLGLIPFLFIVAATSGYFLKNNPGIYHQMNPLVTELLPPGMGVKLMAEIQAAASNWHTLGGIGLISLVFVATGLFDALDESINAVMGAQKKIGFFAGKIISFLYVVGAIIFFSVAAVAGYTLELAKAAPFFQHHPQLIEVTGRYFSVWVGGVFLLALYMIFPVKTPKFWHAVVMAFAITAAQSILERLGTVVTAGIMRRRAIYGALAGAAVFLTWMYLQALLILLGARILDFWRGAGNGQTDRAEAKKSG
jgi:membrane protein